ncbi:sugar transferase [Arthrobacter psychrochitiniphilus]|uniref:Polyprenyl glycosylphosphotransferase n=1 Tax=Arthrobacter psychrochitiniphilus TaxID=291045 RepID=A0A2V3DW89_9MICC|nr:sugar transferase [Arthrobacter psychrochitiniphilus]PXA69297.1 polyprenyl glycosylphosphotransferase [Arthrobacter psychrochitiniphilus]
MVDAVVVTWSIVGAHLLRFGLHPATSDSIAGAPVATYTLVTILLPPFWWLMLGAWGSREPRMLGAGAEEYKRVLAATLWLFGTIAIVAYALQIDLARSYVGSAFPLGAVGLIAGRWVLRQHLRLERSRGGSVSRLLLVGGPSAIGHLVSALQRAPNAGYSPIAGYLASNDTHAIADAPDLPLFHGNGTAEEIRNVVSASGADAVAITTGVRLTPQTMRQLGWDLAAANIGLILAPALTDIAGPRIHTQPVAGLPLIHVSTPKLTGGKRVAKRSFDVLGSALLILILSPVLAVIALTIKLSSPGPVLYFQERVGLRGSTFKMTKFRSMVPGADHQLDKLLVAQGSAGTPLFKVENDPRITPIGGILRKYSLDELPQLFNVFFGSMSLVGPRPQRDGEVALYDHAAHRRLYVQPGMSGLWQVSGRSNLTWDESIKLDLYYVENWSMAADLLILFKTFKAVFFSTGAV